MELVQLDRFELGEVLGSGADYEVSAARDNLTGRHVVVKRPNPDYITRNLHGGVERLSELLIDVHGSLADSLPSLAHLVGYTEVDQHSGYFGDSLEENYRVLVQERAKGIPLVSDIRDKFKGIPTGLGQNLFALYPLVSHPQKGRFTIVQQLMDVEEAFHRAGHLLLDMRPENLYFDPAEGLISVIDIGATPTHGPAAQGKVSRGDRPRDIHDFFAEVFTFYATPSAPPSVPAGYREPSRINTIPFFDEQVDSLIQAFSAIEHSDVREAALGTLEKVRSRSYTTFQDFRKDFDNYLSTLEDRLKRRPDLPALVEVWHQALEMFSNPYWRKFLFDPDPALAEYKST